MNNDPMASALGSLTSIHSYQQNQLKPTHASTSFVHIGNKRSWHPPPSLVTHLISFFPSRAPLVFVTCNPGVRLYAERTPGAGFVVDNYSIGPTSGNYCLNGGYPNEVNVEDDAPTSCNMSNLCAYPYGDEKESKHTVLWRDHAYPSAGFRRTLCALKAAPLTDTEEHVQGSEALSSVNCCPHSPEGGDREGEQESESPLRCHCWGGPKPELSLCVAVQCGSQEALQMAMKSAWWLARYYGVSLTLRGMKQEQISGFKKLQNSLFIKELTMHRCIFNEDWLQAISTCSDLLSLSITSCGVTSGNIVMTKVNSILSTGSGKKERVHSNWYLSGIKSLGLLIKLRCFHLVNTLVHPELIESLVQLRNLECVVLHKVKGINSLSSLAQLPVLQSVSLMSLFIDDADVQHLGGCPSLQQLVLDDCRKIKRLDFLPQLKKMRCLSLSRDCLVQEDLAPLGACVSLVELHLSSLRGLTDIAVLQPLKDLETLVLQDNLVTNNGLSTLTELQQLKRLSLFGCRHVTHLNNVFRTIEMSQLVSLTLAKSSVRSDGLQFLSRCESLRYLDVSDCTQMTTLEWVEELQEPVQLRFLTLSGVTFSEEEARRLRFLRYLKFLCLKDCRAVTTADFTTEMVELTYLDLENTMIGRSALETIAAHCERLEFLSVKKCTSVTDITPLTKLRKLLELDVSHTNLTDEGLSSISLLSSLEIVRMKGCSHLSHLRMFHSLPNLQCVNADQLNLSMRSFVYAKPRDIARPKSSSGKDEKGAASDEGSHSNGTSTAALTPTPPPARPATSFDHTRRSSNRANSRTSDTDTKSDSEPRRAVLNPFRQSNGGAVTVSTATATDRLLEGRLDAPSLQDRDRVDRFLDPIRLRSLLSLSLRKCSIDDDKLNSLISGCHHLTYLDIRDCTNLINLKALYQLDYLRELYASNTKISNEGVDIIGRLLFLEVLDLSGCCNVTSVVALGPLRNLREVNLSRTAVTNEGLSGLSSCQALQKVYLSECSFITDLNALGALRHLRELRAESTGITTNGIAKLHKCTALETVYFTKCSQLTSVKELINDLTQLEVLDTYGTSVPTRLIGQPQQYSCSCM